jgi:hypothetical protein
MKTFLAGSLSHADLIALLAEVLDRLQDNAALAGHPPLAPRPANPEPVHNRHRHDY